MCPHAIIFCPVRETQIIPCRVLSWPYPIFLEIVVKCPLFYQGPAGPFTLLDKLLYHPSHPKRTVYVPIAIGSQRGTIANQTTSRQRSPAIQESRYNTRGAQITDGLVSEANRFSEGSKGQLLAAIIDVHLHPVGKCTRSKILGASVDLPVDFPCQ